MHVFDSVVMPIALYGCEVWGFFNIDLPEKLHLLFCKMILKVKKTLPHVWSYVRIGEIPCSLPTVTENSTREKVFFCY